MEAQYSQTRREMLAVVWGIDDFHIYLFGTSFECAPTISHLSASCQIRVLHHQSELNISHFVPSHAASRSNIPSAQPIPATTCWHPSESADKICSLAEMLEEYVNYMTQQSLPCAMTLGEVTKATSADPQLIKLMTSLQQLQHDTSSWTNYSNHSHA